MRVYAVSDVGRVRDINEDSYFAPQNGERFCCVADGMGGHQAGEIASSIAVNVFAEQMGDVLLPIPERMRRAVSKANADIYERSQSDESTKGMGTTITALSIDEAVAHITHVGDSRAYLVRGKSFMQLTTDHTLVEEMVSSGAITQAEAKVHPMRNIITRALGTAPGVEIDRIRLKINLGDMLLLCSDGLCGYVSDSEMADILTSRIRTEDKPAALLAKALDAGGRDNITAMLVCVEEDDL